MAKKAITPKDPAAKTAKNDDTKTPTERKTAVAKVGHRKTANFKIGH